jgi:DUF1680 family protein
VEEYSKLADSIYFHDDKGLYVNLFVPSEVYWKEADFRVRQETRFPDEASTKLIINSNGRVRLHVRVPAWISGTAVIKINGKAIEAFGSPGSYVSLERDWQAGDTVEMVLPMALRYEAMPDDVNLRAILYGPLVLAGGLGNDGITSAEVMGPEGPAMKKHPGPPIPEFSANKRLADWLHATDKPLTFVTVGQTSEVTFRPLHRTSGQRYSIYWRINQTSEI